MPEECHICGKPAEGSGVVEGARVLLCRRCALYAREFKQFPRAPPRKKPSPAQAQPALKPAKSGALEFELAEDYARRIQRAREKKGLTREELGKLLAISLQEIVGFEEGRLKPTQEKAKKIEFALGVKLLEESREEKIDLSRIVKESLSRKGTPSLADVVELKKKK